MEKKDDLKAIERIIGYHFFERQHLIRALTHPAYANELIQKNQVCLTQEAYSPLGDAVLKTSLILFLMEKGLQEKGSITQAKEKLEDNPSLAKIGRRLKIKRFIRLGRGEKDLRNPEKRLSLLTPLRRSSVRYSLTAMQVLV